MVQKFAPNAEKVAYTQKLVDFFNGLPSTRVVLTWLEIETETSVPMRPYAVDKIHGRNLVRDVLKRIGREHSPIHGSGIELSTAVAATDILVSRRKRVFSGIRRAAMAEHNLSSRHLEEMSMGERDAFNRESARIATLSMLAPVRQLKPPKR